MEYIRYSNGWKYKTLYEKIDGNSEEVLSQVYDDKGILREEEITDKKNNRKIEKRYNSSGKVLSKNIKKLW